MGDDLVVPKDGWLLTRAAQASADNESVPPQRNDIDLAGGLCPWSAPHVKLDWVYLRLIGSCNPPEWRKITWALGWYWRVPVRTLISFVADRLLDVRTRSLRPRFVLGHWSEFDVTQIGSNPLDDNRWPLSEAELCTAFLSALLIQWHELSTLLAYLTANPGQHAEFTYGWEPSIVALRHNRGVCITRRFTGLRRLRLAVEFLRAVRIARGGTIGRLAYISPDSRLTDSLAYRLVLGAHTPGTS